MQPAEIEREYQGLTGSDPASALQQLPEVLDRHASTGGDDGGRARLLRQAALAARATRDLRRSTELAEEGIDRAEAIGDHNAATMLSLTIAYNHFLEGDAEAAIDLVESLDGLGDHLLAATIDFQKATIFGRLGRLEEAASTLEAANEQVRASREPYLQIQILKNLGMVRVRQGACETAERATREAHRIAAGEQLDFEAAFCEHNLGLIASHAGDLPTAFAHFERAERQILRLSGSDFESKASHCRALLSAGLFREAAAMASAAADQCESAGFLADAADSRMIESGALLELRDLDGAGDSARRARAVFASHDRLGLGAAADLTLAIVDRHLGRSVDPDEVRSIITRLDETGMLRDALMARLLLIELLTEAGEHSRARAEFDELAPDLERVSADLRLAGATTEASLLAAEGEQGAADAAAIRGFELLIEQQSLIGSADLRVALRQHARQLGQVGLGLALERGDHRKVLAWSERSLITASTPRPVRPPDDPELGRALARLRSIEDDDGSQQAALEEEVRTLARAQQASGWGNGAVDGSVDIDALAAALGERAGLSIATHHDRLVVSTMVEGEVDHRMIDASDSLAGQLRALRSDLRRRATTPDRARPERIQARLEQLDHNLLAPLDLGRRELVVAPGSALSAVPWASLPSRVGQPTSTTTSLSWWADSQPAASSREVLLIAGPDLDHAGTELAAIAEQREIRASTPRMITVADALTALDGASAAHIVAHGTTRVDNPLFSSLRLADGELSVYELADLDRPPDLVVLSACHVGLPAERPGQELLGMVTGLLNAGTSCVIASTLPVPDDQSTIDLMTRLHRFVADGMSPAVAWAEVQRTCTNDEQLLDTASFSVFGRG